MTDDLLVNDSIKLTQFSHGAGCGCKIAPKILDEILHSNVSLPDNKKLLVGNSSKDDAAVYDLGNGMALISTTDFFTPIVDDAFDFGRIASSNAISDVYAMGGKPILAIAILGWPINKLPASIAQKVIEGSRKICQEAGIPLAGGHSIDSPEPIFGLAVNGLINTAHLKKNNTAKEGDAIFLTKPLGVGILTTAEKKNILQKQHEGIAAKQMMQLNKVGETLAKIKGVNAMTDVTGFGLLGHLLEMCEGSGLSAEINFKLVPLIIPDINCYTDKNSLPGGTHRNYDSYGNKVSTITEYQKAILADPQTSGGLLIAVESAAVDEVAKMFKEHNLELFTKPIGTFIKRSDKIISVK